MRMVLWLSPVSDGRQALAEGAEIIVCTPGRLEDRASTVLKQCKAVIPRSARMFSLVIPCQGPCIMLLAKNGVEYACWTGRTFFVESSFAGLS